MATGGYAGGALTPGSDIDVILLHPGKASAETVRSVAEGIWYPMWDGGVKLSPAAHSTKTLLALANDDLVTATSILRVRTLAGDDAQVRDIERAAVEQWRRRSTHWLQQLRSVSEERWAKTGEIASLLEPDLKDGQGGLRDYDSIRWALAVDRARRARRVGGSVRRPRRARPRCCSTVRCELHRVTGKTTNVLLLQDQDGVAEAMGFADADVLMAASSGVVRGRSTGPASGSGGESSGSRLEGHAQRRHRPRRCPSRSRA